MRKPKLMTMKHTSLTTAITINLKNWFKKTGPLGIQT